MDTHDTAHVVVSITASLAGYQALRYAVAQARARQVLLIAVRTFARSGPGGGAQWREAVQETAAQDVVDAFGAAMGGVPGLSSVLTGTSAAPPTLVHVRATTLPTVHRGAARRGSDSRHATRRRH